MTRRVLITGSRDWSDVSTIRALIDSLPMDTVVIVGDANGADKIARVYADERGLVCGVFYADWANHGKAAGPMRNQRMIDKGRPTEAHAFPLPDSRGTWDCVRRCETAGIPVTIHRVCEGE